MRNQGLTKNQKIVFSALQEAKSPLTAYKILDLRRVQEAGLKAPLTIYRALEGLLDKGLAHRIESLNAFVACSSAPHTEAAAFMICETCGLTTEMQAKCLEQPLHIQAHAQGFHPHKTSIELLGICQRCQKRVLQPSD